MKLTQFCKSCMDLQIKSAHGDENALKELQERERLPKEREEYITKKLSYSD